MVKAKDAERDTGESEAGDVRRVPSMVMVDDETYQRLVVLARVLGGSLQTVLNHALDRGLDQLEQDMEHRSNEGPTNLDEPTEPDEPIKPDG